MIQRIQTLYLFIVVALMSLTLFLPVAYFTSDQGTIFTLNAFNISGVVGSTWVLGVLLAIAALLPLVTIFLFKNRKLQVGLVAAEGVLLVGAIIFIALFYWLIIPDAFTEANMVVAKSSFGWAAFLPVVSLIPTYLAGRAIFKDEVLVRSLDRIR